MTLSLESLSAVTAQGEAAQLVHFPASLPSVSPARYTEQPMEAPVFLDVEEGPNQPLSLQLVFSALEPERHVLRVRTYDRGDTNGTWHDVVAWNNDGTSKIATGVKVEDSGQAYAYLIYGGDGGVRLRPAGSADWAIAAPGQWGESHLLLTEDQDIEWA